ncbi:MAG: AAA family ATPase [Desulfobacula sp.]|nr:AAA family ATPase [Desulfobacula sp.]
MAGKNQFVAKSTSSIDKISENPDLQLAWDFVQYTDNHIFLTGKAGTGKTTFLHNLSKNSIKRMIVTAPTGVAAINAGGVTLHSFFQLPFGPFVPGSHAHETSRQRMFRFSKEKKQIIKSLDLLVIDEISMVRADLLDAINLVLQRHRNSDLPFGGVQLLMIGDLHQLSPVAKHDEWALLKQYYESVYFFSSHTLAQTQHFTIELKHVYRQSDIEFIKILNKVRNNKIDASLIDKLNQRHIKDFTPTDDQGYITLTTHNKSADIINKERLNALPGKKYYFKAQVSGDFPEHTFPTSDSLEFKQGAQVMFLRNDTAVSQRYYNGKIGKIKNITEYEISIRCPDDPEEIVIEPVEWENIKYTINEESREIQEDIIGKFKQFPLKPAWAITIHKSQGLTFDKAVIDAQRSFSHGQVYVALSRCKTFEGMVLASPIPSHGIETDKVVLDFLSRAENNTPDGDFLEKAKISYQQKLLLDCFDFQLLFNRLNFFARLLKGNQNVIQLSGVSDIQDLQEKARKDIFLVSQKFKNQLQGIFQENMQPETDERIQERTGKACTWFKDKFSVTFNDLVEKLYVETDNKELGKRINNSLENLRQEIKIKFAGVKSCEKGFFLSNYLNSVSKAKVDLSTKKTKKSKAPVYDESDIEHPELFQELKEWRTKKAKKDDVPAFYIMHQKVLIQIVINLPQNRDELEKIAGVGPKTIEKYGEDILDVVVEYRKQHKITKVILPEPARIPDEKILVKKNKSGSDTRQISFDMFNRGLSIPDIAAKRELVEATIQGHLGFFIEKGELEIDKLVSREKQKAIKEKLSQTRDYSLKTIKEKLGNKDNCSYGDIKLVISHLKYLACRQ